MGSLIPWGSLRVAVLAILATSVAISTTGLYVLGISVTLAKSLTLGIEEQVLIYSPVSRVPHTGLISKVVDELVRAEETVVLSYEVLTPVMVGSRVVFLRGLDPAVLGRLVSYSLVGQLPGGDSEVIVGIRLGRYLNVSVGQVLEITGIPTGSSVRVLVSGIILSGTPLDDEVISCIGLSQRLRGVSSSYVTLVRVVGPRTDEVYLDRVSGRLGWAGTPLKVVSRVLGNRSLSDLELVDEVLGRGIGLASTLLWASMLLVLSVSVPAIYFGTLWSLDTLTHTLEVLRSMGLSRVRLASALVLRVLAVGTVSGALGYLVSTLALTTLFTTVPVSIMLHTVELVNDLRVLIASVLLPSVTSSVSVCLKVRRI